MRTRANESERGEGKTMCETVFARVGLGVRTPETAFWEGAPVMMAAINHQTHCTQREDPPHSRALASAKS